MTSQRILVTGGTGLIGQRLIQHLIDHGHDITILSRKNRKPDLLPSEAKFLQWDGKTADGWGPHLESMDIIVNLAGAGIADSLWTSERKRIILDSRIHAGQAVVAAIKQASKKPKALIQASAVGYYGASTEATFTEDSPPGKGFLAEVCVAWEDAVKPVPEMGVRTVILRTGVVLDPNGGALPKLVLPFRLFAGGPLGSGAQWFPWIHYADEVAAIRFLIEHESAHGPFNLTAPNPVRNRELAKTLGKVLTRPALMPAPAFAIRATLGEMADTVLEGQCVLPDKLKALNFAFKFPQPEAALRDLL